MGTLDTGETKISNIALIQLFGWLSLISFGGAYGFIPEIQRVLIHQRNLMTLDEFQKSFVIGQIVPGPNMALCAAIGYQLGGWGGWLSAFFGIYTAPVVIVSTANKLYQKYRRMERVRKFELALRPLILGLFVGATLKLSYQSAGSDWLSWVLLFLFAGLAFRLKLPPTLIIFSAGIMRALL